MPKKFLSILDLDYSVAWGMLGRALEMKRTSHRSDLLRGKTLVRGRFYDLAKSDTALAAGGTYVASLGGRKVAFRIAPDARAGATPAIGRLVRFD